MFVLYKIIFFLVYIVFGLEWVFSKCVKEINGCIIL